MRVLVVFGFIIFFWGVVFGIAVFLGILMFADFGCFACLLMFELIW